MIPLLILAAATAAPAPMNDAQALHALRVMGGCIADLTPWVARETLALDYRTAEYQEKLKSVGTGVAARCLRYNSQLRASGVLFAGAMAEGMLRSTYKKKEIPQRIAYNPDRPAIVARSEGEEMTLCTALKAPQATADLFQTEPASAAEDKQIAALAPVMGQCLREGMKVEMNKPAIRAMLALAAWRIASTPRKAGQ